MTWDENELQLAVADEFAPFTQDETEVVLLLHLELRLEQRRAKDRERKQMTRLERMLQARRVERRVCANPRCCQGKDEGRKVFTVVLPAQRRVRRFCCEQCQTATRLRHWRQM